MGLQNWLTGGGQKMPFIAGSYSPTRAVRFTLPFTAVIALILATSSLSFAAKAKPPKLTNSDCLACHNDTTLTKDLDGKSVSLYVSEDKFKDSIHSAFTCIDCHDDVKAAPHEATPAKVSCAKCHADQQANYDRGYHAEALRKGNIHAARCVDCHGSPHEIVPVSDPKSPVHRTQIPTTCGTCHSQKFVMEASGHSAQPFFSYEESVHGKAVAAGSEKAAVCTDCHGSHEIRPASDPKSPIFKFNVPATCAQCHDSVKAQYTKSIHGQAIARGNWQAPVCTDCHGIHSIKARIDPSSTVSSQALAKTTCARCHEGVRLSQEFGMQGRRASTYLASYHGLASELGSATVANCASCHGVHDILPSSDPHSRINKANLVQTCSQCHPGVTEKFALSKVHVDEPQSADIGSIAVRWIRRFYVGMIVAVIGAMLLHNFLIWRKKAVRKLAAQHRVVVRLNSNQRIQHFILLVSFFLLVITGFMLKYPDSWLASIFGMGEKVRGIVHRVAAVALIGAGLYHVFYVLTTRDGKGLIRGLLPDLKDGFDLLGIMRHYLGLDDKKPEFGRFTYAEKLEYWALVWGMIVMASTGIMLWAKMSVGHFLPRWYLDIATAIHFYEAVLATLAIVVWHFYQVIFDPDVYPMSWAWWDGKVSLEHYREEHALDPEPILEGIAAEQAQEVSKRALEKPAAEPAPSGQEAEPLEREMTLH
jgi:cytochrome b subunit of formate dehydrogenase